MNHNSAPAVDLTGSNEDAAHLVLDCFLFAIQAFAECVEAACPPVGVQFYDQLVRIRRRLAYNSSKTTLDETRDALENALTAYAEQAHRYVELRTEDRNGMLDLLNSMEEVAFEKAIELEAPIGEIRKRLTVGQQLATVDPLTGLSNRREIERQVILRIGAGKQFCVLFFDIDDFGLFNESLGRESGDQVLKQFAARLTTQIRARDVASRWLADEFIVILECDMENARRRSVQMSQFLRGPYVVEEDGREAKIEVRVSAAAAECLPGDSPRQLWMRLEEDFHRQNAPAAVA